MTFNQWMESVPQIIKGEPVWKVQAYRLALFAGDLAWSDVTPADYVAEPLHLLDNPPLHDPGATSRAPRVTHHVSPHAP
jgi:hypothetical protein